MDSLEGPPSATPTDLLVSLLIIGFIYCRAQANAESIQALYEKEAEAYEDVIHSQGLQLSTKGFLSYIGIRTISSAVSDVYVGMKGPAKTSYVEN